MGKETPNQTERQYVMSTYRDYDSAVTQSLKDHVQVFADEHGVDLLHDNLFYTVTELQAEGLDATQGVWDAVQSIRMDDTIDRLMVTYDLDFEYESLCEGAA